MKNRAQNIFLTLSLLTGLSAHADNSIQLTVGNSIQIGGFNVSCGTSVPPPSAPTLSTVTFTLNSIGTGDCMRLAQAVQGAYAINPYTGDGSTPMSNSGNQLSASCNMIGNQTQLLLHLSYTPSGNNSGVARFRNDSLYPDRGGIDQRIWQANDQECMRIGQGLNAIPNSQGITIESGCNTTMLTRPYFYFNFANL